MTTTCTRGIGVLAVLLGIVPAVRAQQPVADPDHVISRPLSHVELVGPEDEGVLEPTADPGVPALQQPAQTPPPPAHTGLAALMHETGADFRAFPRRRSTWVILGIGGAAAALAHPADDEVNARLVGSRAIGRVFAPGKYVGSAAAQMGVGVGLYLVGRYVLAPAEDEPKTNKWSHLGFDLVRANIVAQLLTQGIKVTVRRDRPTGECCAFPSGHTSTTFAVASVLERHLGYRAAWPTLVIASYVGASRMHDNRHFLSDVLFGAALGTATGWTVVGRHGRSEYALVPAPINGGVAVTIVHRRPPTQPSTTGAGF